MKRVRVLLVGVLAVLGAVLTPAAGASNGSNSGSAWNMQVVGHNDLGGRGFNADVWAYKGYAYVGQWGFGDWAAG